MLMEGKNYAEEGSYFINARRATASAVKRLSGGLGAFLGFSLALLSLHQEGQVSGLPIWQLQS